MAWFRNLVVSDDGQDLIEYGLLAAFISFAVVAVISTLGSSLSAAYTSFATDIEDITS